MSGDHLVDKEDFDRQTLGKRHSCGESLLQGQASKSTYRRSLEQGRPGSQVGGVAGSWVGCSLSFSSHGEGSGLVRNLCRSHAVWTARGSVVSADSTLLSPSPLHPSSWAWVGGREGLEEVGQV